MQLDPILRNAYESVYGSLFVQSKQELDLQKQRQKDIAEQALQRINNWLSNPKLIPWIEKIKELKRKGIKLSFYSLIDERVSDARKYLENLDDNCGYGYLLFKEASNLIHGSTIEQLVVRGDTLISPKFTGGVEESELIAEYICSSSKGMLAILSLIQKDLWL